MPLLLGTTPRFQLPPSPQLALFRPVQFTFTKPGNAHCAAQRTSTRNRTAYFSPIRVELYTKHRTLTSVFGTKVGAVQLGKTIYSRFVLRYPGIALEIDRAGEWRQNSY